MPTTAFGCMRHGVVLDAACQRGRSTADPSHWWNFVLLFLISGTIPIMGNRNAIYTRMKTAP
jgi:hypothetical protein